MRHFAYPNVAQGQFLGCGRYLPWPAEQTPPPGYHVATLTEVTNPQAVYATAQHLAPELRTMEYTALVYEQRDRAEHDYRGDSLDLAYLLATLSCVWPLQGDNRHDRGDIWCTGRITYLAGQPWLDAVAQPGFERKLEAFVCEQTQDHLFLVPAANLHQHHKHLCREYGVQILSLEALAAAGSTWPTRLVLPVAGDELPRLVTLLFAIPPHRLALQDRVSPLLPSSSRALSWEAPLPTPGRERVVGPLPGAVVQHFQGRERELGFLRQQLVAENVRLVLVCGRGGMGKTALVTKLLHEVQGRQFTLQQSTATWDIAGIVYATLRQPEYRTPDKLIELICRTLEPQPAQELRTKWQQRSSLTDKLDFLFRRSLAGQHYLIVLDNCEDILDADNHIREEFADLRHFVETCLEHDHGTRLLVTSRHRLVFSPALEGRFGTRQAELSLDAGLPLPDAVTLLRALDPEGRLGLRSASEPTLREVAQRCHGIPRTLETLVGTLRQRRTWTLERLLRDEAALGQLTENPARELYESLSSDARCVMQVLAVYDRPVPTTAVQSLLSRLRVDDVLDTLVSHYVVAYEQGHFSLHPLDRHYAYRQIPDTEAEGTRAVLHAQAAAFFRHLRTPPEHWHTIADLDPQLQEFQHLIQAHLYDQACALLNGREGRTLLVWGHAASLVQLRSVLVDRICDSALQAANLDQLGEAYWRLGAAREAMRYHEQALTMSRQLGHRQQEARCLTNIGAVYWILGQPQEARESHEQALAIFRTLSTTDDRWGEAHCLGNLGIAHQQVGEVRSAIAYYEQHLQRARELDDGRGEGRALINLGFAYSDIGDLQTAMAYYEQGLTVAHRIGDRWNAGRCVGNMGLVYDNMGRTQDAIASFEHALAVFREIGDRRVESDLLGNIADVLARSGNFEHAILSYHEALKIAQEVSDKGGVSEQWLGLAYACHHLGDLTAARRAYHEGLTLAFPLTHYRCAILLGILCAEEGNGLEAQHHYTCGIDLCRVLLARTPHLFRPLYSLALAHLGNRQPHEALATYQHALAVCSAPGVVRDVLQDVQLLKRISPGIAQWDEATQLLEAARGSITG